MFSFRRYVVAAVVVVLGLSDCGASPGGVPSSPSVSWEERDTPDIVTTVVPDGQEVLTPGEIPGTANFMFISDREPRGQEEIGIGNFSPEIVGMHGPDVDTEYRRDEGVEHGTVQKNSVGRGILLEPRLITSVKAWGYVATATLGEESTYPIQRWPLWREDKVWLISVAGFVNTSVIPAELIRALDTISFVHLSGTPATPHMVTTASPSLRPSPNVAGS